MDCVSNIFWVSLNYLAQQYTFNWLTELISGLFIGKQMWKWAMQTN